MHMKQYKIRAFFVTMLTVALVFVLTVPVKAQEIEVIDFDAMLSGPLRISIDSKYGLADALASPLAEIREMAYNKAGDFGPDAITVVAPLLDNDNPEVVRAAKIALEKIAGAATETAETRTEASRALAYATTIVDNRNELLRLLANTGTHEALEILWRISQTREDSYDAALMAIENIAARSEPGVLMGLSLGMISSFRTEQGPKRIAMINAMGTIGLDDFVPHLIWEVQNGPAKERAIEALGNIGHTAALDVVRAYYVEHLDNIALEAMLKIAEGLDAESAREFYNSLLASDKGTHARVAAISGISNVATVETLPMLIALLGDENIDIRGAAHCALVNLEGDQYTTRLVIAALQAEADNKSALLNVLYARDAETGRVAAEAALNDESPSVRITALTLLGEEPSVEHEQTFLDASRRGTPESRKIALQGYLSLAERELADNNTAKALTMFHRSLSLALEDEERIRALNGLTEIGSPDTLNYLEGMQHRQTIHMPMARCAIAIAKNLHESDPVLAREIYEHIYEVGLKDRAVEDMSEEERQIFNSLQKGMRSLGIEVNFAQNAGIITNWQFIGPFPLDSFEKAYPPEIETFDENASYAGANDQQVAWHRIQMDDVFGVVELHKVLSPNQNVKAYARAVVRVEDDTQCYVKIGSDDGIKAWVNRQLVHENDVQRGLTLDQDVKPAILKAGENEILLKITQAAGEWQYVVRLTDRQNAPLTFNY